MLGNPRQPLRMGQLEIQRLRYACGGDVGVAMRPGGIVLCRVVPGISHCEPVDRIAVPARTQLRIERREISPPSAAVAVARQTGPIPVAVIMQVGTLAGFPVAPRRQDGTRVMIEPCAFLGRRGPGSNA